MSRDHLRVGINVVQNLGRGTGMTTYTRGIVEILRRHGRSHEFVLLASTEAAAAWREVAAGSMEVAEIHHPAQRPRTPTALATRLAFDVGATRNAREVSALRHLDLDVVHHTGDRFSPLKPRTPTVLSFFSANYWLIPSHRIWSSALAQWGARKSIELSLRRADVVVVPSITVRDSVIEFAGVDPGHIVVATPVSLCRDSVSSSTAEGRERVRARYGLVEDYFLCAAAAFPYKNHRRLIEAFSLLDVNADLVLIGADDPSLAELAEERGVGSRVKTLGFVPTEELGDLYAAALALVHPSLYEAAGSYSMYEAMYAGTPVLCSRVGSMLEVAGDAALMFDPLDPSDIAASMEQIAGDGSLRASLIESGRRLTERYSDEQYAAALIAAYTRAAERANP